MEDIESRERARLADVTGHKASIPLEQATGNLLGIEPSHLAVMSSEYFSLCDPYAVAARMRALGVEVVAIACYLRRQDVVAASGWSQMVKAEGAVEPVTEVGYFVDFDYELAFARWAGAFPGADVQFRNYRSAAAGGNLAATFKGILGCEDLETTDNGSWDNNPGLSAEMTEIARMINGRGIDFRQFLPYLSEFNTGERFAFSPRLTEEWERIYRRSNKAFARRAVTDDFSEFCATEWTPPGIDLTGRVSEERCNKVLAALTAKRDAALAAMGATEPVA